MSSVDLPLDEDADPTYTHFSHASVFFPLLAKFLECSLDKPSSKVEEEVEEKLVKELGAILDHYLPLPPLLDPSLSQIIPPLMSVLASHLLSVYSADQDPSESEKAKCKAGKVYSNSKRLGRLGRLVEWVCKVRGRKGVVTHFPPEIIYLPLLLYLLSPAPTSKSPSAVEPPFFHASIASPESWELRTTLLSWLSLLLTVPFSLSAFSPSTTSASSFAPPLPLPFRHLSLPSTAQQILRITLPLLRNPGKEGQVSGEVLARLVAREDGVLALCGGQQEGDGGLLKWVREEVDVAGESRIGESAVGDVYFLTNILYLLALLPPLLPRPVQTLPPLHLFLDQTLLPLILPPTAPLPPSTVDGNKKTLGQGNGLLRKMAVKSGGRWWIGWLGAKGFRERGRKGKRKLAVVGAGEEGAGVLESLRGKSGEDNEEEDEREGLEVPDGVEEEVGRLMDGLSDKDTIVRYSSAKYLSRITALLPPTFAIQIVQGTIELFASDEDEASQAGMWHGICLALAEMARRGLVRGQEMGELMPWVLKALVFDYRRGSHSIGSQVRDSAAYLLWSLSRASNPEDVRPWAEEVAVKLVAVGVFDREVGIRRAGSAAFQEGVGRMGLYPNGIDVLGKTDFYSVSVRRTAFLVAAPQVAEHEMYRKHLLDYLHRTTLRHWDPAMRVIGAQALKLICALDEGLGLAQQSMDREMTSLPSLDSGNVHGAIVALTELASLLRERGDVPGSLPLIMQSLLRIRPTTFTAHGADLLLEVTCVLIKSTACAESVTDPKSLEICWRILDLSMKSRKDEVQDAAAAAAGAISGLRDCSIQIRR